MRKLLLTVIITFLLLGCTQNELSQSFSMTEPSFPILSEEVQDPILTPPPMEMIIYSGNENADGFVTDIYEVYYFNTHTLIEKLIEVGTLNDSITLQAEYYNGTCLHLDFNDAFLTQLSSMGSSGEYIMIGSIVNSFLDNYNDTAESIYITVDGKTIESGHVIYDFELTRYE